MGEVIPFPKLYFKPNDTEAAIVRLIDVANTRKPGRDAGLLCSIFCGKEDQPTIEREDVQRD
jgi:hypothetical protein